MGRKHKAMWDAARQQILFSLEGLRSQPFDQLLLLRSDPIEKEIVLSGIKIDMCTWAEIDHEERLVVVTEARRNRFLGWSNVAVEGFAIDKSNHISELSEEDLWERGY